MPPYTPYGYSPYAGGYQQPMYQSPYAQQLAGINGANQYQNLNAQMQQPQQSQGQPGGYTVVTSVEEAKAYPPDLSGAPQVFYNKAQGQFYTKTFDVNTATAQFDTYDKAVPVQTAPVDAQTEPVAEEQTLPQYLTPNDLEPYKSEIERLNSELNKLREDMNNAQYAGDSEHDGATEPTASTSGATCTRDATAGNAAKSNSGKPTAAKPK